MKLKKYFLVDLTIFVGFLVSTQPHLTGISIHEWLALSLAGVLTAHLLMHWKWVIHIGVNFFRNLFHRSRLQFALDVLLLIDFAFIMLSGLMISRSVLPVLNIQIAQNNSWKFLHEFSAELSFLLVGLHLVLHWKWIVSTMKRLVSLPTISMGKASGQAAPLAMKIEKDR